MLELDDQNQKNPEQSLEAFDVLKQDSQQSLMTCTTHNFAILQHLQYLHYNSFGKRKKKKKHKQQTREKPLYFETVWCQNMLHNLEKFRMT